MKKTYTDEKELWRERNTISDKLKRTTDENKRTNLEAGLAVIDTQIERIRIQRIREDDNT
jgi:hypothetical protein